jgi:DNA-binding response OmpR family regulator
MLKQDAYDLVVFDLGLPGMRAVAARMRERGHNTGSYLSARDQTADRVRGLDLGADDYLNQTFRAHRVRGGVRAHCDAGRGNNLVEIGAMKWSRDSLQAWIGDEPLALTRTRPSCSTPCYATRDASSPGLVGTTHCDV